MLKEYTVLTKVEAFLLKRNTDKNFIGQFLVGIPHTVTNDGLVIVTPNGEVTIEFDKYYMMFEPGSRQLITIEKKRFEDSATLVKDGDNLDSWEGSNETVQ